ncbi:MAG: hypothetical protein A3G34_12725 [Candidatus Lindowbacteria bacterium RIFCSPLOWO2_12_FULL_62_27]|nr:MAG: hypothetical protein A3I06_15340 [Candidatus Lindowbacteria bacterium RIFCSPLOWO2_02_FULL_62_12]OGH62458.1 MAG: hypothetical protein A3G34_12725 [Candidatus Lindowbacteria bacterium RIFCSPLOWO2_12_FULL_62_27]
MSIAVLPFECAVEDGKPYAKQLEATVEAILIDMKRFTIVERANLLALLDEQKLSMSGLIDQELTGGIVGGVQYLVVGRINTISQEKTYNQATNRTAAHVSYNASASLFFKILNVETGEAIFAKELSVKQGDEFLGLVRMESSQDALTQLVYKYKLQLRKILAESFPIEGMIVGVEGESKGKVTKALVSLGEADGMVKGLNVEVVTRQSIGGKTRVTKVATGKIHSVEGDFSVVSMDSLNSGKLDASLIDTKNGASPYYVLVKTAASDAGGKTTSSGPRLF